MSGERRLTEAEREALRARVLAAIEREERRRRTRRLGATAVLGLLLAGVLAVAAVREEPPEPSAADAISVRCGGWEGEDALVPAEAARDPRLVCAELWRRTELVGADRRPVPSGACAQTTGDRVLVLVYDDPADACRVGAGA